MIREAIEIIVSGRSLSFEQAAGVMEEIMSGDASPAQFASLVTGLRIKGETVDEIAGLASVMRTRAIPVVVTPPVLDTCGTGGDNSATFNISTAVAFVAAGAGLKVAKHGNRAMSSHCGSADVLEALGVKIDLGAEAVAECVERVGIGFMFAPVFHPAMKYATAPRREIGIRTVFNILGPLTNPARAESQVIGVPSQELGSKIASVLHRLGTKHSLVVHGIDGMDEISISGKSLIWNVNQSGTLSPYQISPQDLGFNEASLAEIKGGTPEENAEMLHRILGGERSPRRDVVVMNAAAALVAGNRALDLREGTRLAEEVIDSGQALKKLDRLVRLSQSLG
ncbi:MAG TPA: anthranilate phosphoribosyltransferase [Dehalococcoidia bacterium]|nr:anthranilate phosphoribosyltransferase [Dehalococcoidia bacterium]